MVKGLMHRGEIGGVILGETGRRAIGSRRPLRGNLHLRHGVSLLSSSQNQLQVLLAHGMVEQLQRSNLHKHSPNLYQIQK